LERLGITYFHETFGNRNSIERWFREMKERTKRFYNNVNAKTLKCIEEIATAVAIVHNLVRIGRREGNTNLTVPVKKNMKEKEMKNLTISLVIGILILSLGIFLVGKHIPYGNLVLIIGSTIVYISIIILAWKV
jgi:hypothetical protein